MKKSSIIVFLLTYGLFYVSSVLFPIDRTWYDALEKSSAGYEPKKIIPSTFSSCWKAYLEIIAPPIECPATYHFWTSGYCSITLSTSFIPSIAKYKFFHGRFSSCSFTGFSIEKNSYEYRGKFLKVFLIKFNRVKKTNLSIKLTEWITK